MCRFILIFGCFFIFILPTGCFSQHKTRKPVLHIVEIKGMRFEPAELVIAKGDTVLWKNADLVPHNVTEASSKAWRSPMLKRGDSWSLIVESSSDYFCSIHVVMKAKLVVNSSLY